MIRGIIERKSNGDVIVYKHDRIIYPDGSEFKINNDLFLAIEEFQSDGTKFSVMYR
jgi:hypothetical protein